VVFVVVVLVVVVDAWSMSFLSSSGRKKILVAMRNMTLSTS
jgi:hypothetical protein